MGLFRTIVRAMAVAVGGLVVVAMLGATCPRAGADSLADGEEMLLTVAWSIAAALFAWHTLGLVVCAAARTWPHRRLLWSWARWSPALARRAAGIAAGASFVLQPAFSLAPAPVGAATVAFDEPFVRTPAAPAATTPAPAPAPAPAPIEPAPIAEPVVRTHLVVAGDNLWRIASAELARVRGAASSDRDTITYWRAVIDANRTTLRSNDPSLIHPGELVVLPPV